MPSKTLLIERGSKDYICRSCLSSLGRRPPPTPAPWAIRQASQAAARASTPRRNKTRAIDDAERLRTLEKLGLLKREKEEERPTVNYFQEDGGKLRRLANVEEFNDALNDPGDQMKTDLQTLERGAGSAKSYFDMLERAEIQEKNARDQEGLELAMKKALYTTKSLGPDAIHALDDLSQDLGDEPTGAIHINIDISKWPVHHREKVTRLNNNLQLAARQLDRGNLNKLGFAVWKYYFGARQALSKDWTAVPPATWELLWDIFATESPQNPNRWHHVHILAKDMSKAGVQLFPKRQLMAIEALFLEGWHKEAMENHRRKVTTLGTDPETFVDFWQLGLRMCCHVGDLDKAKRLADTILGSSYQYDIRFLLPLIRAYAQKPETAEKAHDLYRVVQAGLGDAMTIEDYDLIISLFLVAQQPEKALWIFVEMMTSGRVDLRNLEQLPPSVANEFFVGKWLKRLIGVGDLEGAYNALQHMKSRGVMPRPMVVNVLIGSWLRTGVAENVERAEQIAWAMINSRLQFVKLRAESHKNQDVVSLPGMKISHKQSGAGWPKATLETFSLLAENYKDRGVLSKMEELWEAFKRAEMGANTFFMNQLLFSLLRNGRGLEVPKLYRAMIQQFEHDKLGPDSWTFLALWQALPPNRLQSWKPEDVTQSIVESRRLFAEMVSFAAKFQADDEGVNFQLARTIMHTFRQLKDPLSMLVAFRALRQIFQLKDPGSMVLEMIVGTTNLERAAGDRKMRNKIMTATQHTEQFLSQRQQEMVVDGELRKNEEMPDDVRSAEMADFLEMHLEAELNKIENADELFEQAARDMGVI
ncbi:hypothetical protein BKA67DRAFT_584239 [Truncatella angustata]|uniref:Pentatricopeptide repeat protein n=1 Tax=Truncatella angustata TaxID=152316 RepID=A0A9P8RI24_9PEZI|nr:uncharacterized protein BKA67DRAFT_584239 [Truncatella angustata]KAH6646419.1 hypothetical protein BKA67DRAFT_584239 [Truncatella angustata]KAH8200734.1 hypothetical protein TruAng_005123 [Truncatella angustata]